jgi:hypothetical protein
METMGSAEYAQDYAAAACPVCRSGRIFADTVDMSGGATGFVKVDCRTCGSSWTDLVQITGYVQLNEGKTKEAF